MKVDALEANVITDQSNLKTFAEYIEAPVIIDVAVSFEIATPFQPSL